MTGFDSTTLAYGQGLAQDLFKALREGSYDAQSGGVCRDTYGKGEQFAHDLMRGRAQAMGLTVSEDHLCNSYMVWPGRQTDLPVVVIGSHLDSVPAGGNYDGAAGVVAGLVAIEMLRRRGVRLERDLVVMGVRAEESIWFQHSYIGSRGALGILDPAVLANQRIDTGQTLQTHLQAAGGDVQAVRQKVRAPILESIEAFFELHIEQAPSLAVDGYPVAIGTAIPGNVRYAQARILGEYGHVGLPKRFRRDAALAGAQLFVAMEAYWEQESQAGKPLAVTIGQFHTNPDRHGLTIVAGEFDFSIDMRAYDEKHLRALEACFLETVQKISDQRQVQFELGARSSAAVALANDDLSASLRESARKLNISCTDLLSPASHDSAAFCAAGIPFGFVFVRNPNGSHHPQEHMEMEDFMAATQVLAATLAQRYSV